MIKTKSYIYAIYIYHGDIIHVNISSSLLASLCRVVKFPGDALRSCIHQYSMTFQPLCKCMPTYVGKPFKVS